MMRERRCVGFADGEERKKGAKCKINKILVCKATVIVHICIVTVAFLYIYTILQALI